jgi:hypothetical protein
MWKLRVRDVVVPEISVFGAFTEQWDGKWVSESVHRPSRTPSHQPLAEVKVLGQEYVFWIAFRISRQFCLITDFIAVVIGIATNVLALVRPGG